MLWQKTGPSCAITKKHFGAQRVGKSFIALALAPESLLGYYYLQLLHSESPGGIEARHLPARLIGINILVIKDDWAMVPLNETESTAKMLNTEPIPPPSSPLNCRYSWHQQIGDPTIADGSPRPSGSQRNGSTRRVYAQKLIRQRTRRRNEQKPVSTNVLTKGTNLLRRPGSSWASFRLARHSSTDHDWAFGGCGPVVGWRGIENPRGPAKWEDDAPFASIPQPLHEHAIPNRGTVPYVVLRPLSLSPTLYFGVWASSRQR